MTDSATAPLPPPVEHGAAHRALARAAIAAGVLLLLAFLAGFTRGAREGYPVSRIWTGLVVAALFLVPYFALASTAFRAWLVARFSGAGRVATRGSLVLVLAPAVVCALTMLHPVGPDPIGPVRIALYLLLPFCLLGTARAGDRPGARELAAILALWLPIELNGLRGAWTEPREEWETLMNVLLATNAGVFLFAIVRRLDGLEYTFLPGRRMWAWGVGSFLAAAPLLLAGGLSSGFLHARGHPRDLATVAGSVLVVFLFNALPEELLFRGLIQNTLTRWFGRFTPALVVSSIVFGLSHLNNGHEPNWRFAALATIAGLFYGIAYRKGGGATASALTHTLVNVGLTAFFRHT